MFLAVTCHLHFWQNDRDLLRATAVTRGWNGYAAEKLCLVKRLLAEVSFRASFEGSVVGRAVTENEKKRIPDLCSREAKGTATSKLTLGTSHYLRRQRAK